MASHQSPAKPMAIYARISKDRSGKAEGVDAQEKWGREYIKEHWPHASVVVFKDNDRSAADEDVYRPRYEALREAIRRKEVGGLWAVEQSRLTRVKAEWFRIEADLVKAGIEEVHTRRNGIIEIDSVVAGITAVLDDEEVKKIRKRTRDLHLRLAADGRPGGPPGFGHYQADKKGPYLIHPEQAKVIGDVAKRILRGESLSSIAARLNEREVPTARGGKWGPTTLAKIVTKPQVAGLRAHNGGKPQPAQWQPIIDRKTWEKVCAAVRKSERTVIGRDGAQRTVVTTRTRITQRHLLTGGIAVCGLCGASLGVQTERARSDRKGETIPATYTCNSANGGCYKVTIIKADLDQWITELVQVAFLGSNVGKALAKQKDDPRTPLLREIGELQREIDELADLQANGGVTLREWRKMRDPKAQRLATLESALRNLPTEGVDIGTSADAIVDEWETYTIAQKQRVIRLLFSEVRVLPANHPDVQKREARKLIGAGGRRTFDPRRVKFVPASKKVDDKVIAGLLEAVSN